MLMQEHIHCVYIMLSASSDFLPTLIYLSLFFCCCFFLQDDDRVSYQHYYSCFFMFNLIGD